MNGINKKIFISTGELSGEVHACRLVEDLNEQGAFELSAMGTDRLAGAGARIVCDYRDISVTGLSEVLSKMGSIKRAFKTVKGHIAATRPDLVVLVDFPGFNMRIARYAKGLGIPVIYFIPPQIWAWRKNRVKKIRLYVDMVICILPFEKDLYIKAGVDAIYIGHPFSQTVKPTASREEFLDRAGAPRDKPILAILPGSRENEVARHMPVLAKVVSAVRRQMPDISVLLPLAGNIDEKTVMPFVCEMPFVTVVKNSSHDTLAYCDTAIVASGSVTLEAALLRTPTIIVYRVSWLSYVIARLIVHVRYIGLPNIIAGKEVFPEFIQHLDPEMIAQKALSMIDKGRKGIADTIESVNDQLTKKDSYRLAGTAVKNFLEKKTCPST